MADSPNPDLLQVLEYTLETVKRMSTVLRSTLHVMDRGERLSDATIADYRQQLDTVERNQKRLEELIRALWSQVEKQ
jgi:hypothetical protein